MSQNNNNNNYRDRRTFERFPLSLPVRFFDFYRQQEGEGKTVDISAKGMGLVTEKNLNAYTPLEIWVDIPQSAQPFYARAEVVWSKPISQNLNRVGIEFEQADLMGVSRLLRAR
jgi:c-di-GMP-binding flagellar brake protein YcgR